METNIANIEVVNYTPRPLQNTNSNDLLIYVGNSNQRIHMGTSNMLAILTVTCSNVGILTSRPTESLTVGGNIGLSNFGRIVLSTSNSCLGIGTSNPLATVDIRGSLSVSGPISFSNGSIPSSAIAGLSNIRVGGIGQWENATTSNAIYILNSNVGIGTSNPQTLLDVQGSVTIGGNLNFNNAIAMQGLELLPTMQGAPKNITNTTVQGFSNDNFGVNITVSNSSPSNYSRFVMGTTEVARLTGDGKLGIGTSNPQTTLDVQGSVTIGGNINLTNAITMQGLELFPTALQGALRNITVATAPLSIDATDSININSTSNVNVIFNNKPQGPEWASLFSGSATSTVNRVVTDLNGNVYVCGKFNGTGYTLRNADGSTSSLDIKTFAANNGAGFLFRYNALGIADLALFVDGQNANEEIKGIDVDRDGNIYIVGIYAGSQPASIFKGTTNIATMKTSSGVNSSFFIKFNSLGDIVFVHVFEAGVSVELNDVCVDQATNVSYVCGTYGGGTSTVNIYENSLASITATLPAPTSGANEAFMISFDSRGAYSWNSRGTNANFKSFRGIKFRNGLIYCVGTFTGAVVLYNGNNSPVGPTYNAVGGSAIVVVYNATTRSVVWWAGIDGNTGTDNGNDVAVDSTGNVYLCGQYSSQAAIYSPNNTIASGFSLPTPSTPTASFLVKYNSTGTAQWCTYIDSLSTVEAAMGLACDILDNVYLTGYYTNASTTTPVYNGAPNPSTSSINLPISSSTAPFVIKYDTLGVARFAYTIDGNNSDQSTCITTDPSGNLFVGGFFNASSTTTLKNLNGTNSTVLLPSTSGIASSMLLKLSIVDYYNLWSNLTSTSIGFTKIILNNSSNIARLNITNSNNTLIVGSNVINPYGSSRFMWYGRWFPL